MAEMNLFHYTERNTFLHRTNPLTKIFTLLLLSIGLARSPLVAVCILFLLNLVVAWVTALPFHRYRREIRFFLVMGLLIFAARSLQAPDWIDPVTALVRFATIVLMGMIFADSSAPDDIARSIGSALSRIPGVRGYRTGATIELTIATIPLLFNVASEVSQARKARCDRPVRHPVRSIVSYTAAVFELLLDRSQQVESALKARQFDPDRERGGLGYSWRDPVLACIVTGVFFAVHYLSYRGY